MNPFIGASTRTVEEVSIKFIENVFNDRKDGYIIDVSTAIQFMDMIDSIAATLYESCVEPESAAGRADMLTWGNNLCDPSQTNLAVLTTSYWNLLRAIRSHFA